MTSSTAENSKPDDSIIIVSGLPRSGTSLMMQMLAAGGVPPVTDSIRAADESNPRGYFELEAVKRLRSDQSGSSKQEVARSRSSIFFCANSRLTGASNTVCYLWNDRSRKFSRASGKCLERSGKQSADRPLSRKFIKASLRKRRNGCERNHAFLLSYHSISLRTRGSAEATVPARIDQFVAVDRVWNAKSMAAAVRLIALAKRNPRN